MQVTNYQPGARGVNLKDGRTIWVEPGQTVDIDGEVQGDMPDFGKKPDAVAADDAGKALDAANARIAELEAQVADLTSQLDAATTPKK